MKRLQAFSCHTQFRCDDDGIVVHDAEYGDKAYPDGDAEVVAKEALEPGATRNGRRNPGREEMAEFSRKSSGHKYPDEEMLLIEQLHL